MKPHTRLSVNLNKVALLRNARTGNVPNLVDAARRVLAAGAAGITVHPRPDLRHVRPEDLFALNALLREEYPDREFNIEGNPMAGANTLGYPGFMALLLEIRPTQATLVPDDEAQLTSDHGWALPRQSNELADHIARLDACGVRVSLFMDPDAEDSIPEVVRLGAQRVEIYTGPYADAHKGQLDAPHRLAHALDQCVRVARAAERHGLGINAGHDLNLDNLSDLVRACAPLEVSIGHALIADALVHGLNETVRRYTDILQYPETP